MVNNLERYVLNKSVYHIMIDIIKIDFLEKTLAKSEYIDKILIKALLVLNKTI